MTTNEFIKKVKGLGYITMVYKSSLSVYATHTPGIPLLSLETDQQFSLHIHSVDFNFFVYSDEDREKLYNLAVEYDKTPVDKREEKKKYHLQLSGAGISEFSCYLNRLYNTTFFFANDEEGHGVKTKFTDEEISELPDWVSDMLRDGYLIKEEAKDDNKN